MSAELAKAGPVLSSDVNQALISLYSALENGWDPPSIVTEEEYKAGKALPDSDPMRAFIGFGCSFGGKWFGGYARSKDPNDARSTGKRTYASQCRNSLLDDLALLKPAGWHVVHLNFLDIGPLDKIIDDDPTQICLYLDPPYAGTEAYGAVAAFDHNKFWARVLEWSEWTDVFVSEYNCPLNLDPVLEFKHDLSVAGGVIKDARTERLYHFHPEQFAKYRRRR
jgi:DNA adenine methylase